MRSDCSAPKAHQAGELCGLSDPSGVVVDHNRVERSGVINRIKRAAQKSRAAILIQARHGAFGIGERGGKFGKDRKSITVGARMKAGVLGQKRGQKIGARAGKPRDKVEAGHGHDLQHLLFVQEFHCPRRPLKVCFVNFLPE
jgi:hypothetical protein